MAVITMFRHVDTDEVVEFVKFIIMILSWIDLMDFFREYIGETILKFIEHLVQRSIIERTLLYGTRVDGDVIYYLMSLTSSW